jgi:hypothetical protein
MNQAAPELVRASRIEPAAKLLDDLLGAALVFSHDAGITEAELIERTVALGVSDPRTSGVPATDDEKRIVIQTVAEMLYERSR